MPVEKEAILQRLHTAEGHLHAVSRMVAEEASCQQVLHQLNAVQCAIEAVGSQILQLEIEGCLQAIREDPCPEQCFEQLAILTKLYPMANKFALKDYETLSR